MDFALTEEQEAVAGLAAEIVSRAVSPDTLATLEAGGERVDARLWSDLVAAGLVGIALPAEAGGAGLGMVELGLVLEALGRHVAKVPLWPAALGAGVIARYGGPDLQPWVAATVDGSARAAVALEEYGPHNPDAPATTAAVSGDGWVLTGTKAAVVDLPGAAQVVFSATTPAGTRLFLVDPAAEGARTEVVDTTDWAPAANLVLDSCPAQRLGPDDDSAATWLLDRVHVALAWLQAGVAAGALERTAQYLAEREQFGRPLGTFQAVAHRIADCHISVQAMRVTALHAAWQLDDGEAGTSVLVAAWWASDAGQRIVHDVMHLHGGIGVDLDHPIHRYLLAGRGIADTLGGPSQTLARLGERLEHLPELLV
jgi:3-oxocholest-4-en-26-oyl-CoA dehydrogenase beta subunit